MKKFVSLTVVLVLLLTMCSSAFAQTPQSKKLEELILKVKSVFPIPEDFSEFNSNSRTVDNVTYWSFNWSEKPVSEMNWDRKSISVEVSDDGFIRSYSNYDSSRKYSQFVKIPSISKEQATEVVKQFIAKACPQIENELSWKDPTVNDGQYIFHFSRIVNEIEANFNSVSFYVNGSSGEIINYYSDWNTSYAFPSPKKAISKEKAQEIYQKQMPLNLEYKLGAEGNVYVVYSPSREKGGYFIDAFTGEPVKIQHRFIPFYADEKSASADIAYNRGLSPEEQKEVDNIAGTITVQDAEKKLRAMKELNMDDSYKFSSSHLNQIKTSYNKEPIYYLHLNFVQIDPKEKLTDEQMEKKIISGEGNISANATFNAKTGELLSFASYNWAQERIKSGEASVKKYKKTADSFLEKYQSKKVGSLQYAETEINEMDPSYQYYRIENGIYYFSDGIYIAVDEKSGKIKQYNYTWTENVTFPSTQELLSAEKAHEILFDTVGLKMEYVLNDNKVLLVYKTSDESTAILDAKDGKLLGYDGKPIVEEKAPEISEFTGHYAETAIKELINVGIIKGEFNPDKTILQKDYLFLLTKLGKYYYGDNDTELIYKYMIQNGIMDESEKNPESSVTREDAVKYLLRYMDYKKVAEIPGIFHVEFADMDQINPALVGYAAIAKGLGVINGADGNFNPKSILTNGESAVIISNCLKANFK